MTQFGYKDMNIILVGENSRESLNQQQALEELGYRNILRTQTLNQAVDEMQKKDFQWILCPLHQKKGFHILQFLGMLTKYPSLHTVKVSAIIDEREVRTELLGKCFEMGLLSYHTKSENIREQQLQFRRFFREGKVLGFDCTKIASDFGRKWLMTTKRYRDLLKMEGRLLKLNPGDTEQLLKYAIAQILAGHPDKGRKTLQQTLILAPDKSKQINEIGQQYLKAKKIYPQRTENGISVLGIESAMIISKNEEHLQRVLSVLQDLGVPQISQYNTYHEALNWLDKTKNQPELVIQDWEQTEVPGAILVQKLKKKLGPRTIIMVSSKELSDADQPLLEEMGVLSHLAMIKENHELTHDVIWRFQQNTQPTDHRLLRGEIKNAIDQGDLTRAEKLREVFNDHPMITSSDKLYIDGEIAWSQGASQKAVHCALEALKLGHYSVPILNLLGKALMKLRSFDKAVRALEMADFISPFNIERVCQIAEAHLEIGHAVAFNAQMKKLEDFAPEDDRVKEVKIKSALVKNDLTHAKKLTEGLESFRNVVAFTNNRAIALIHMDKFHEGISLYNRALHALPECKAKTRNILLYNLGLAWARAGNLHASIRELGNIPNNQETDQRLLKKTSCLLGRIQAAVANDKPLRLHEPEQKTLEDESNQVHSFLQSMKIRRLPQPGELRLFQILQLQHSNSDYDGIMNQEICFNLKRIITPHEDTFPMGLTTGTAV